MRVHKNVPKAAPKSSWYVCFIQGFAWSPAPLCSYEEALMNRSWLGEIRSWFKQLDLSAGALGAASLSADQSDQADRTTQWCFHCVPLVVGHVLWELLDQRAGPLTSQAVKGKVSVFQLDAEEEVIHPALQEGANWPPCSETECNINRLLWVQKLSVYVHVAPGLKWKHCGSLAFWVREASKTGACITVLTIYKYRWAYSTIFALVVITAWKCNCAGLSTIQATTLALFGAKASKTSILAFTYTTILTWLLLTSTDDLIRKCAWKDNYS